MMNNSVLTTQGRKNIPRVKLGTRHQITIPAQTIKRLGLKAGEELELVESEKAIVLVPRKHIPKDQRWYYTDEWRKMMQDTTWKVIAKNSGREQDKAVRWERWREAPSLGLRRETPGEGSHAADYRGT